MGWNQFEENIIVDSNIDNWKLSIKNQTYSNNPWFEDFLLNCQTWNARPNCSKQIAEPSLVCFLKLSAKKTWFRKPKPMQWKNTYSDAKIQQTKVWKLSFAHFAVSASLHSCLHPICAYNDGRAPK